MPEAVAGVSRRQCIIFLLLLLALVACDRDEKINLFEGYYYGMSWEAVKRQAQAESCPDSPGMLCRKNPAVFFKMHWEQRFVFRHDKLIGVRLSRSDPKSIHTVVDSWLDDGYRYMPVLVASAGKRLDVLAELKRTDKQQTRLAVKKFAAATASDPRTTYLYLDFDRRRHLLDAAGSYDDLLRRAPRDLPGIEEKIDDKTLCITFLAPVAEWQDARRGAQNAP